MISENFVQQGQALLKTMRKDIRQKDAENIKPLELELRDRTPEAWKDAPVQQLALNAIASIPSVTTVLCGLRRESYIDDALKTFEKGDFADPARVIGAHDVLAPEEFTYGDVEEKA
jgi:aryl-alcohol dehydrogenase-like predicted oxidoreductase